MHVLAAALNDRGLSLVRSPWPRGPVVEPPQMGPRTSSCVFAGAWICGVFQTDTVGLIPALVDAEAGSSLGICLTDQGFGPYVTALRRSLTD